jgi:hypothetical protein
MTLKEHPMFSTAAVITLLTVAALLVTGYILLTGFGRSSI